MRAQSNSPLCLLRGPVKDHFSARAQSNSPLQAETLAPAVSQSPYFAALRATADKRRTEQFPEGTDREAWHTVVNTIKVLWSAGWYTDAEAEYHLAQIIVSSQQYASSYTRAWLGLDE